LVRNFDKTQKKRVDAILLFGLLAAEVVFLADHFFELEDGLGFGGVRVGNLLILQFLLESKLALLILVRFLSVLLRLFVLLCRVFFEGYLGLLFYYFTDGFFLNVLWFFVIFIYCAHII
jgi:hypothetical protein